MFGKNKKGATRQKDTEGQKQVGKIEEQKVISKTEFQVRSNLPVRCLSKVRRTEYRLPTESQVRQLRFSIFSKKADTRT